MNTSSAPLLGQAPRQLASVLISVVLVQKLANRPIEQHGGSRNRPANNETSYIQW